MLYKLPWLHKNKPIVLLCALFSQSYSAKCPGNHQSSRITLWFLTYLKWTISIFTSSNMLMLEWPRGLFSSLKIRFLTVIVWNFCYFQIDFCAIIPGNASYGNLLFTVTRTVKMWNIFLAMLNISSVIWQGSMTDLILRALKIACMLTTKNCTQIKVCM